MVSKYSRWNKAASMADAFLSERRYVDDRSSFWSCASPVSKALALHAAGRLPEEDAVFFLMNLGWPQLLAEGECRVERHGQI